MLKELGNFHYPVGVIALLVSLTALYVGTLIRIYQESSTCSNTKPKSVVERPTFPSLGQQGPR